MNETMNPLDLSVKQLRRAAAIKEQIEALNRELRGILGTSTRSANNSGAAPKKRRTMSAAAKKKIAAAQRARWANFRRDKTGTSSAKRSGTKAQSSAK
jgi:hypothetical protein